MEEMNWFDIGVLVIIGFSAVIAFFRGFVTATLSTITWLTSVIVAIAFYDSLQGVLGEYIKNERFAFAVSLLLLFIVTFIILAILCRFISKLAITFKYGVMDRTLGLAFGFFRGVVIVCIAFYTLTMTSQILERDPPSFLTDAKSHGTLEFTTAALIAFVPNQATQALENRIQNAYDNINEVIVSDLTGAAGLESQSESGDLPPLTLTQEQRDIMKKIISAIPKEKLKAIKDNYQDDFSDPQSSRKRVIFKEILQAYRMALIDGQIPPEKMVGLSELKVIGELLIQKPKETPKNDEPEPEEQGTKTPKEEQQPEEETIGYKKQNIDQFNRLINTF